MYKMADISKTWKQEKIMFGNEKSNRDEKSKKKNWLTKNYFNSSLLTIHTEFVSVQDKFSLY